MQDVFGFVIFHGCFPVSKGVEVYLEHSEVAEFVGDSSALFDECFS